MRPRRGIATTCLRSVPPGLMGVQLQQAQLIRELFSRAPVIPAGCAVPAPRARYPLPGRGARKCAAASLFSLTRCRAEFPWPGLYNRAQCCCAWRLDPTSGTAVTGSQHRAPDRPAQPSPPLPNCSTCSELEDARGHHSRCQSALSEITEPSRSFQGFVGYHAAAAVPTPLTITHPGGRNGYQPS